MFQFKSLHHDAIPAALEKAHRYRLLNEPQQAESICEDVLRLQPENQDALATLILALTEFSASDLSVGRETCPSRVTVPSGSTLYARLSNTP